MSSADYRDRDCRDSMNAPAMDWPPPSAGSAAGRLGRAACQRRPRWCGPRRRSGRSSHPRRGTRPGRRRPRQHVAANGPVQSCALRLGLVSGLGAGVGLGTVGGRSSRVHRSCVHGSSVTPRAWPAHREDPRCAPDPGDRDPGRIRDGPGAKGWRAPGIHPLKAAPNGLICTPCGDGARFSGAPIGEICPAAMPVPRCGTGNPMAECSLRPA